MVAKIISLSAGKQLRCGFAFCGMLLSAGIFDLATAETTESENSKPVRILLTDDTPDETLSVRRKFADQRNLDKLYNNELRPAKSEPKQVVEAEVKYTPQAEIVTSETLSPKTEIPAITSFDALLPTIKLSKLDIFGDVESAFTRIGNELSLAATSAGSKNTLEYDSKMKHPGNFTPRYDNRAVSAKVHLPTIGSLDRIEFPKIKLSDFESIFGLWTVQSVDENGKVPESATVKQEEETSKSLPSAVEDEQSGIPVTEGRGIMALLGLDGLKLSEFSNPFAVGTGLKETEQNVAPAETENINPALDENNLEPDETITTELPRLRSERPAVPGVNQIPTLAPKAVPEAPNSLDEKDKSASRVSPYKTLINPDRFLQQRSAVPVSVRISDSLNR